MELRLMKLGGLLSLTFMFACRSDVGIKENFDQIDKNLEKIDSLTKEVEEGFKEKHEFNKSIDTVNVGSSGWKEVSSF